MKTVNVKGSGGKTIGHYHLGQPVLFQPDSADTVRCPFCGQERKA